MKVEPFTPAKGLKNAHLQTLFPALFRKKGEIRAEIETFELDDGDFVDCYWYGKPEGDSRKPIVILFHGLQGSFHSSYIQGMMPALKRSGYSAVLMHFRGCSGRENRLARSYHSGDTADAAAWIAELGKRYPHTPLYAIGYSLGGNMLLKLLGEQGSASLLSAAVSISAPIQLELSAGRMERGFSRLYQHYLLRELKRSLGQKYDMHPMQRLIGLRREEIKKIKNFHTFDDLYTAPIHGFRSADDYYQKSSARQFLKKIKTPALIIQALDDPFMTEETVPEASEISAVVTLEVYPHGGHVGFVGGSLLQPEYWLEKRVIAYLSEIAETVIS